MSWPETIRPDRILAEIPGLGLTLDELLWGGLLVGLIAAAIHLVTMLVTRWGDSNPTGKSLLCSILLHVSCALGLVVVNPPESPERLQLDEKPFQVQPLPESEDEHQAKRSGNRPVWERPPESPEQRPTRMERVLEEMPLTEPPERRPEKPRMVADLDLPDLANLPERTLSVPQPEDRGETGPQREAAKPTQLDEETAERKPEAIVRFERRLREPVSRSGQEETEVARKTPRGSVDRMAAQPELREKRPAIEAKADPTGTLERGSQDRIVRRKGPVPAPLELERAGTSAENTDSTASSKADMPSGFTRQSTRSLKSVDDGAIERHRPGRIPQTPQPESADAAAVRRGRDVDVPRTGPQPDVARPNFDAVRKGPRPGVPRAYRLRDRSRRADIARQYGGTEDSERAVEASLRWLAEHQHAEGYWDADRFGSGQIKVDENDVDRRYAGKEADTGLTGLAVLAFLGAGYTHEEGQYAENVEQALRWLVAQQTEDGYLGGGATHYAKNYCHAMAAYALAEAYGMQGELSTENWLREPLRRAVDYILANQNPEDGGWRYLKGQDSDMSMFGWQLMALKSADIAGINMPGEARRKMIEFLKDRSLGENDGLAAYRKQMAATPPMTAEALFCKQMLGLRRDNPASREAVDYLLEHPPRLSELNFYYWYYGTLAMYQYGGEPWQKWNEAVREELLTLQRTQGDRAGSWDPKGPWGPYGGRVYSTALSTLCLEVYYRFLPLYRMGGRYGEE